MWSEEQGMTKVLFNTQVNMEALIYPMYVVKEPSMTKVLFNT